MRLQPPDSARAASDDLHGIHGIQGGDFPATYPMLGTRPELLTHREDEVERMIELDGDGLSLKRLLASAQGR